MSAGDARALGPPEFQLWDDEDPSVDFLLRYDGDERHGFDFWFPNGEVAISRLTQEQYDQIMALCADHYRIRLALWRGELVVRRMRRRGVVVAVGGDAA